MPSLSLSGSRQRQRGVSLTEAMVAFVVMGTGMLAMVGMQSTLNANADISRQRAEAVRLAEEQMERMRAYVTLAAPPAATPGVPSAPDATVDYGYADLLSFASSGARRDDLIVRNGYGGDAPQNIVYTLTPTIVDRGSFVEATVNVSWTNPHGTPGTTGTVTPETVQVDSIISRVDPALTTRLKMKAAAIGFSGANARHRSIPIASVDLGDDGGIRRSAFGLPGSSGSWLFNNTTGVITHVCTGVPTAATAEARDAARCTETVGTLVSGNVRFSTGDTVSTADAETPLSAALNLDMALSLTVPTSGISAVCYDDAPTATDGTRLEVHYFCAVLASTSTPWSGRLTVLPQTMPTPIGDWTFGSTASQFRLCRYSDNYDGSKQEVADPADPAGKRKIMVDKIENREHPATYADVKENLINQNFLVIKGSNTCPADGLADPAHGDFIDSNTVQQEPAASGA
jgi:hypothetical protein